MAFPLNIFYQFLRSVLTFDVGFEEVSTVSCAIKSQGQTAFKPLAPSWHKQRMAEDFPASQGAAAATQLHYFNTQ